MTIMLRSVLTRLLLLIAFSWPSLSVAIVGGVPVAEGEVVGQVALVDMSLTPVSCTGSVAFCKQFCSGVLIAKQWVLTAAHCVNNIPLSDLRVVAGTRDLSSVNTSDLINVVNRYVHGQYAIGATFNNDIALLKLEAPLDLPLASIAEATAYSSLVAAASSHDDGVTVSGWGRLSSTGGFPTMLQKVAINWLPDSVCDTPYNNGTFIRYVPGNMLCAGETTPEVIENDDAGDLSPYDATGEGVCNYDSGGPLTFFGNGFRQVAGLTSFAPKDDCASATLPSVFTKVANFAAWIEASGKDAGDFFGDLALTIEGDTGKMAGATATITVRMRNASGLPSGIALPPTNLTGAGFTVMAPTGTTITLSGVPSSLSCVAIVGGYTCTSTTTLTPSATRQATFILTPAGGDQVVDVTAEAFTSAADNLVDYRQGNNHRVHHIVFSSQPDIALKLSGFAQEVVNITPTTADGRAWVIGRVINRSTLNAATNVSLALALPAGYQWEAWEGLDECSTESCVIALLAPNAERQFRARIFSTDAVAGDVQLTVTTDNGDYPSSYDGVSDTEGSVAIAFNVVVDDTPTDPGTPSEPPVAGSSGGGSIDLSWLMLLLMTGVVIRRRVS